jgi:hypothetical protein
MSAAAKSRTRRRAAPPVRTFRGYRLTRVGSQTVVVTTPAGATWGWAASFRQARRVVDWLTGGDSPRSRETDR